VTRAPEPRPPAAKAPRPSAPAKTADTAADGKKHKTARPPARTAGDAEGSEDTDRPIRGEEVITVTGSTIERKSVNAPAPVSVVGAKDLEGESLGEEIAILGARRRGVELSAALAGGLAIDHGGRGLLALDVRLETTRRTRLGGEAALWLVSGDGAEGRVLLTVGRSVASRLDLGFGAGVHFGNGAGVAGALRLGVATPLPWLSGVLRYDAALLLTRPTVEAEHALTLGVELTY
jgi:hypothetical protein